MKKALILIVALMIATPAGATLKKSMVEANTKDKIINLRRYLASDTVKYANVKAKIEDVVATHSGTLDASDITKLNQLISEVNDVMVAVDDLITKYDTAFPNME